MSQLLLGCARFLFLGPSRLAVLCQSPPVQQWLPGFSDLVYLGTCVKRQFTGAARPGTW